MAEWLRIGANIASILTAVIAAGASIFYWASKRSKRIRLENYLKAKKERSPDEPFSITRLMADLGMTEAEIFAASFRKPSYCSRSSQRPRHGVCSGGVVSISRKSPRTDLRKS